MVRSTGGDSGATSGGVGQETGLPPPPPSNSSSSQPAVGPTPSRLLKLFKECVDNGVWAKLVTYKTRRGCSLIEFNCRVAVATAGSPSATGEKRRSNRPSKKRRAHNRERVLKWKEANCHPPQTVVPDVVTPTPPAASLPAVEDANATVNAPASTTARSFAAVVTANTETVADQATAGRKGLKAPAAPKKPWSHLGSAREPPFYRDEGRRRRRRTSRQQHQRLLMK